MEIDNKAKNNSEERKQILAAHPTSYRGVVSAYNLTDILKSYPFYLSLFICFILLFATYFSKVGIYNILIIWVEQIISIFPNILGFNLGGYALIVGFGNTELVKNMTKPTKEENKYSIFQKMSSVFSFTLLLQSFTFAISFVVNFIIKMEFTTNNIYWYHVINGTVVALLSFFSLWSIFVLSTVILNVFTFGQMHHLYLTTERMKNNKQQKE